MLIGTVLVLMTANSSRAAEIQATAAFAVARDPSGQRAAAMADALLQTKVRQVRNLRLIEPSRVLSGDPRTREEETLERARAALADGRRAYDALALDDAIARLGQAVSFYQQTGPLLGDVEELQTALAYFAAALTLRGSADEGESTFLELLTVNPSYQLSGFPPTVVTVFENALTRLESTASGGVEIYSTPPYAAVFIDGRFEGVTPLVLKDLVAGPHYLRLEKVGYAVHGAPLEISPNQQITSQTRLRSIKRGVELRDLTARGADEVLRGSGMGGALRTLSRELVADVLLFVSVSQSGNDATFTGGVFNAATGERLGTERVVLSVDASTFQKELGQLIDRMLKLVAPGAASGAQASSGGSASGGGSGAFGLGGPPPPPRTVVVGTSGGKDKTSGLAIGGWVGIGVGGGALIGGIVAGVLAKVVHDDYRDTPQASPDLEDLRNLGKLRRDSATGCFVAGGVLVGIGAALLITDALRTPSASDLLQTTSIGIGPTGDGAALSFSGSF